MVDDDASRRTKASRMKAWHMKAWRAALALTTASTFVSLSGPPVHAQNFARPNLNIQPRVPTIAVTPADQPERRRGGHGRRSNDTQPQDISALQLPLPRQRRRMLEQDRVVSRWRQRRLWWIVGQRKQGRECWPAPQRRADRAQCAHDHQPGSGNRRRADGRAGR